jgi:hypothetical protein
MPINLQSRPLKVCSTCRSWSYTYKGLCARLNQGVGKFWSCEDWSAAADRPGAVAPGDKAPPPKPPQPKGG